MLLGVLLCLAAEALFAAQEGQFTSVWQADVLHRSERSSDIAILVEGLARLGTIKILGTASSGQIARLLRALSAPEGGITLS